MIYFSDPSVSPVLSDAFTALNDLSHSMVETYSKCYSIWNLTKKSFLSKESWNFDNNKYEKANIWANLRQSFQVFSRKKKQICFWRYTYTIKHRFLTVDKINEDPNCKSILGADEKFHQKYFTDTGVDAVVASCKMI